jgi:hypothetical protein
MYINCLFQEILRWLGLTVFEIVVAVVCFTVFTILLTLKLEGVVDVPSFWIVFAPLFVSDALNAYFCVIIFIRMYIDVSLRLPFFGCLSAEFTVGSFSALLKQLKTVTSKK